MPRSRSPGSGSTSPTPACLTFDRVLTNPNRIHAWDEETEEGVPPTYFPKPEDVTAQDHGAGRVDFDVLNPAEPWLYYVIDHRIGTSGPWTRQVFAGDDVANIGGGRLRLLTSPVAAGTYSVRIAATGPRGVTGVAEAGEMTGTRRSSIPTWCGRRWAHLRRGGLMSESAMVAPESLSLGVGSESDRAIPPKGGIPAASGVGAVPES